MKNFQDKIVVITGAGSGMGRAYAQEFGNLGAQLALNDYNAESLEETVAILKRMGVGKIYHQAFDVSSREAMGGFARQVKTELGPAHVVINNAGVEGAAKPTWAIAADEFERVMAINFWGVVNGTQAFLPQLLENNEGAVVNVSSIFGLIGTPNNADYCASKFAVRGFTESLMVELQDSPVNAYLVHPGGIATNIAHKAESSDFNERYLITPPKDIVRYVIKSLGKKRLKIVYGHSSLRVWLASNLVPLGMLVPILWREMKKVIALQDYARIKQSERK